MFSAASVCLFVCLCVCQHNNFRTSKHRMTKVGGRCIVQKSRPSSNLGVIAPWVRTPKCVGLRRCENQRKLSIVVYNVLCTAHWAYSMNERIN